MGESPGAAIRYGMCIKQGGDDSFVWENFPEHVFEKYFEGEFDFRDGAQSKCPHLELMRVGFDCEDGYYLVVIGGEEEHDGVDIYSDESRNFTPKELKPGSTEHWDLLFKEFCYAFNVPYEQPSYLLLASYG